MLSRLIAGVTLALQLLLWPNTARASSCDEEAIAAMSLDQAAHSIWANADTIGFGYVATVDTPERYQQFIDFVLVLKGNSAGRIAYAPLRIGRVGWHGPGLAPLEGRPDEIRFLALVQTEQGYVVPVCQQLIFDKDTPGIIRRLVSISDMQDEATSDQ